MKTAAQVLEYIAWFYATSTDIPQQFFRDVDDMEHTLGEFETLYEFIVDDSRTYPLLPRRLHEFMTGKGYGARGFKGGNNLEDDDYVPPPPERLTNEELDQMKQFAKLWHQYLASDGRLKVPSESDSPTG